MELLLKISTLEDTTDMQFEGVTLVNSAHFIITSITFYVTWIKIPQIRNAYDQSQSHMKKWGGLDYDTLYSSNLCININCCKIGCQIPNSTVNRQKERWKNSLMKTMLSWSVGFSQKGKVKQKYYSKLRKIDNSWW